MNSAQRVPGRNLPPKREISWAAIGRLLKYLRLYKLQFTGVLIFIVLSAVASVSSALFLQVLIDSYITPLLVTKSAVFAGLLKALATISILYLIGILSTLFYNRLMATIGQGILKKIRDEMFSHMQTLPLKYFDTHSHGDLMSHYTNDTDALRQMLTQSVPMMFSATITVATVFVGMLFRSIWLTMFVLIFVYVMLLATRKVASMSGRYFVAMQKALGNLNGYIEEMVTGQKVVKVFNHEEAAKEEFDRRNEVLRDNAARANQYANILMPIMGNLGYLLYVLIAVVGGSLALSGVRNVGLSGTGALTLGTIASFLQLSRSFIMPIGQMSQQINFVAMALAGADRVFDLLDEQSETDSGYVTLINARYEDGNLVESPEHTGLWAWKHPHSDGTITYTELKGEIRLFDVDFAYEAGKPVLHDISVYAEPGQKVAFVGATGAGKTTITNLINRFYDIADGKIRYDGININKIKKSDLRRSLGIVLQDVSLFTGTVMDNIRYGRLNATDEDCINAAIRANAHDFITRLPNGYYTQLGGNGTDLSQGQRQLLSIARAAVADPPVMILDEATSSIDTRTEALVQRGMDALMEGRTVFVIAHRLSTVQNADVIMVLEHGRIIERGNHEKLIAERGEYYQLYTGAFELE
jgi:ATP-binding cassette subfamily B protein